MRTGQHLWSIVLAGGSGRRLEPFLRRLGQRCPVKQFCAIIGKRTMLQHTWDRAERLVRQDRVVTVVDRTHAEMFPDQLAARPAGTVIEQPANRETCPGALLPLAYVLRADPDAIVAIFPSDHFVHEERRFLGHVRVAELSVRHGYEDVVILGVPPSRQEPGYGWIEVDRTKRLRGSRLLAVAGFWEKPLPPIARSLYEGGHLLSTMVTVARAKGLWNLISIAQPELRRPFEGIRQALGTASEAAAIRRAYEDMPCVSLSEGVFARIPSYLGAVTVRDVYWSDWGSEERVCETLRWLANRAPAFPINDDRFAVPYNAAARCA